MKALLLICMIVAATPVGAVENPGPPGAGIAAVTGEVLETVDVESYTYLRLQTRDGETWAAVTKAAVRKGDKVSIENVMVMRSFESKSLKRTFPTILFGSLGGTENPPAPHAGGVQAASPDDIHVPRAKGANARTIAEIIGKSAELKENPVLVNGQVVKYSAGIMGKNWIHLRDGTGTAAANTNDILVTTTNQAKIGDVLTVKGIVRTNKDFGAGYAYKVLIEEAVLQPLAGK
ncbi:MAG: nucleotide-binding protein [Bacteroidota bacterium]